MTSILDIRERIPTDVFSILELKSLLENYHNKAVKVASFLRHGEIVQLRRGLYTFAAPLRREPLSVSNMANRIYGPSYVSEDYALSYHGLIPETPAVVTSICMGRSREFTNDFGVFSYRYCRSRAYSIGITLGGGDKNHFLIASPLKALFDKALFDKRWDGESPEEYLSDDLRIDLDECKWLDKELLKELSPFMHGRLSKLYCLLERL